MHDEFKTLRKFDTGKGREGFLYSLPALEEQDIGKISRLPVSKSLIEKAGATIGEMFGCVSDAAFPSGFKP